MPAPKPDEHGRYRVQQDTGAKVSVSRLPLPSEKVLNEPASDVAGDALPVEYAAVKKAVAKKAARPRRKTAKKAAPKSLSRSTPSGQSAESTKEISND